MCLHSWILNQAGGLRFSRISIYQDLSFPSWVRCCKGVCTGTRYFEGLCQVKPYQSCGCVNRRRQSSSKCDAQASDVASPYVGQLRACVASDVRALSRCPIEYERGIKAYLESSSRSLDIRASTLRYKSQYDAVNSGEKESIEDFEFPKLETAADLDSMMTAVLCWNLCPAHKQGRIKERAKKQRRQQHPKPLLCLTTMTFPPVSGSSRPNVSNGWTIIMNGMNDKSWHLPLLVSIMVRHQNPNLSEYGEFKRKERRDAFFEKQKCYKGSASYAQRTRELILNGPSRARERCKIGWLLRR